MKCFVEILSLAIDLMENALKVDKIIIIVKCQSYIYIYNRDYGGFFLVIIPLE